MSEPASCLYECRVMHHRIRPKNHQFTYRMFLFLLDLDELPGLSAKVPIFSFNEPNLYSLHDEDYFRISYRGLRSDVETFLSAHGYPDKPNKIQLLTLPRFCGYTFNPISIFFCSDAEGLPQVALIQVGNTFGELKPYIVPLENGQFHLRTTKHFYVSPFSSLDLKFDFRFDPPSKNLRLWIDDYEGEDRVLISTVAGMRTELTTSQLLLFSLKYPLITLKVILLIHWEAMRLWWKGIPYRLKESDPHMQKGVFRTHPR